MRIDKIVFLFAAMMIALPPSLSAATHKFKIVVNSANDTAAISQLDLANIFLKKKTHWRNGMPIMPVDQTDDSPARQEFSNHVLQRPVTAIKNHWQQQLFSGRDLPPMEKRTDDEVLAFVKGNPTAIGYISSGAKADGVKTVDIVE